MSPKVHHCMGGLLTNMKGQVLDIMDQEPIPGLYAAGEATGGIHGADFCTAVADVVSDGVLGRENPFSERLSWRRFGG